MTPTKEVPRERSTLPIWAGSKVPASITALKMTHPNDGKTLHFDVEFLVKGDVLTAMPQWVKDAVKSGSLCTGGTVDVAIGEVGMQFYRRDDETKAAHILEKVGTKPGLILKPTSTGSYGATVKCHCLHTKEKVVFLANHFDCAIKIRLFAPEINQKTLDLQKGDKTPVTTTAASETSAARKKTNTGPGRPDAKKVAQKIATKRGPGRPKGSKTKASKKK